MNKWSKCAAGLCLFLLCFPLQAQWGVHDAADDAVTAEVAANFRAHPERAALSRRFVMVARRALVASDAMAADREGDLLGEVTARAATRWVEREAATDGEQTMALLVLLYSHMHVMSLLLVDSAQKAELSSVLTACKRGILAALYARRSPAWIDACSV